MSSRERVRLALDHVLDIAAQIGRLATLDLRGLMVIPPFFYDPEQVRPYFRQLRELAREIEAHNLQTFRCANFLWA